MARQSSVYKSKNYLCSENKANTEENLSTCVVALSPRETPFAKQVVVTSDFEISVLKA